MVDPVTAAPSEQSEPPQCPPLGFLARGLVLLIGVPAAALALWIGVIDLFSPPTLADRLLAILYVLVGLFVVVGVCLEFLINHIQSRAFALGASIGSIYIYGSLADYAWFARPDYARVSAALAVLSFLLSLHLFRRALVARVSVSRLGRAAAVVGGLLGTVTAFGTIAYQSIYLPENAQVGMETTITVGQPEVGVNGESFVPVQISLQNKSSITAVALTSMVTVTGVSYSGSNNSVSASTTQQREVQIGEDTATNSNLTFSGTVHTTRLAIDRVISDGSYIYGDGDEYQTDLVVPLPRSPKFEQIDVRTQLDYARTARLQLDSSFGNETISESGCTHDVITRWHLRQSKLDSLTHGTQVLLTNWCADTGNEQIWSNVLGPPGTDIPDAQVQRNYVSYGLESTSRFEAFVLR
jgi:hypothetical protein